MYLCFMKKISVFVFVLLLLVNVVSAQGVPPRGGNLFEMLSGVGGSFYDSILSPLGKLLLGSNTTDGDLFFGKLLIFIILFSLVWVILGKIEFIKQHRKMTFVLSLTVSVLSVRYLSQDWIDTVILPYSVLGIAMTSLVPFLIYLFFVKELPSATMRKIAWVFAFVVFMGMFIYRIDTFNVINSTTYGFETRNIDKLTTFDGVTETSTDSYHTIAGLSPVYIYFFTAILSLIMLFADRTIQKAFIMTKHEGLMAMHEMDRRSKLLEKLASLQNRWDAGHLTDGEYKKLIMREKGTASLLGVPLPDVSHL